jgi:hypothetical protein
MLAVMGRAVAGLVAALVVAYILSARPIRTARPRAALPSYLVAIGVQVAHLVEEYLTGFYREFPPVLGASPWSSEAFLLFNVAWLLIFIMAIAGLERGSRVSVTIALFLALGGGVLNGLAHLVLAARVGGYFPGLYTAPFELCAGGYLAYRLLATEIDSSHANSTNRQARP